jgi:hypothetical protein
MRRVLIMVVLGVSLAAAPTAHAALTPGPEVWAACPATENPTEQAMFNVALTPASGSAIVGSSTGQATFTITSTSGGNRNGQAQLTLDVWDAKDNLVDEEFMHWNGSAYAATVQPLSSNWMEYAGTYRWVVFDPYTTETWDPSIPGPVYHCTLLYSAVQTLNVNPPSLTTAVLNARWGWVVGPHTNGRLNCSIPSAMPWTSSCSLRWRHAGWSYQANGTAANFIGSGGADTATPNGGYFWRYDLRGTASLKRHRTRFHWHGTRGPTNG